MGVLRQELLDSGVVREINFPTAADRCTVEYTTDGKGKAIWLTRQAAVDFAAFNEAKFGPQYPYECSTHKHWHLTSQPPYVQTLAPNAIVAPVVEPVAQVPVESVPETVPTLPSRFTKSGKVVAMLRASCMTVKEVAEKCGVSRPRVYSLIKEFDLPYKSGRGKRKRRAQISPVQATPPLVTRVPSLIERQKKVRQKDAELEKQKKENDREKVELEKDIFMARMPIVELAPEGAIFKLDGEKFSLDVSQCRMLLDQVTKLNRYMR